MDHQCVCARFADHQGRLDLAVVVQREEAVLVGVELAGETLVEMAAHHAAEVANAEPGLGFEGEGVEEAVVAGEAG